MDTLSSSETNLYLKKKHSVEEKLGHATLSQLLQDNASWYEHPVM
jgi:hypothetical protein